MEGGSLLTYFMINNACACISCQYFDDRLGGYVHVVFLDFRGRELGTWTFWQLALGGAKANTTQAAP